MRLVIQRVNHASVHVGGQLEAGISQGFLVYVGLHRDDTDDTLKKMADKLSSIRLFDDSEGRINLSLKDVSGALLLVSQFTLQADIRRGNRPSFTDAMPADMAKGMFESFVGIMREKGHHVETGVFQAHMRITSENDGPVTIIAEM
jgi:D-aminoacyl-tRNA deacylase